MAIAVPSSQVSWQSAVWPVIASMLMIMMQNTGRVCGAAYVYSAALRTSPLVCAIDLVMMLVEFVSLLAVKCSVIDATKHVWYGRFERDDLEELDDLLDQENSIPLNFPVRDWFETDGEVTSNTTKPSDRQDPATSGINTELETLAIAELQPMSKAAGKAPIRSASLPLTLADDVQSTTALSHRVENFAEPGPSTLTRSSNLAGSSARAEPPTHTNLSTNSASRSEQLCKHLSNGHRFRGEYRLFENKLHPGSSIDRTWRLSMGAFMLGAFPQIIKIFAMRGIPWTQALVFIYLAGFIIPEVFRVVAVATGEVELHPMPIVLHTRKRLAIFERHILTYSTIFCLTFYQKFSSSRPH